MRYKEDQKKKTRERILAAAGRSFKKGGYSGVGVDGLAKAAGVTSGAFYGHFDSKISAFRAAIVSGMQELKSGIVSFQQKYGERWWPEFATFYTSQKRTCDLSQSCGLQSLSPEVGRSDASIQKVFEEELLQIIALATEDEAEGNSQKKRDQSWVNLSMLIGGVTLARAVSDKNVSDEIAAAVQKAVAQNGDPEGK